MIKIKNLTKTYQNKKTKTTVLNNINLEIEDGDIFGIIGMSGAGKSTLIRCMNLLEKPTSGSVHIDGINITNLDRKSLSKVRKNIGMIFQGFNLLMQKTVEKNIAFGLEIIRIKDFVPENMKINEYKSLSYLEKRKVKKVETKRKVSELLKIIDLEDKAKAYPSMLSGGQRQRVAIARALATNPSVLLCDEATSALDSMTTKSILTLLKKINEETKVTIVIITHEMNVVKEICNKVAVIDQSEIIEQGSAPDVFKNHQSEITRQLIGGEL
ncbi:methionine ABC transporter ATP-binding protein [Anaeromicropila herbilytica]|uniref:ABC transporter domain-containing protein n=1 Tax=Anaeromicropila herbilytica TaxID=2785025 RepID=A0A7R7IDZ2_9FIRM|nr:ATP-binding cassette domain-containing protein [Anaeromicropila herbilytica]BCN31579.1 hypothetical protein bsdtb5_28740 [Anaeromicropila herbilytica]